MPYITPTNCRILGCTIAGTDITSLLRMTTIHESVCKPYITGGLTLIDSTNLVDNLNLQGGEAVSITFDSPPQSKQYSQTLYLHSVEDERPAQGQNHKALQYTFNLIGPEFYQDASNLVATSHQNQTVSSAIQQIWGQYIGTPLNILSSTIGMIGQKSPYIAHNMKPLTAIEQLRKAAVFGSSNSGNSLLYRNAQSAVLASLQDLLNGAGGGGNTFIQKDTWGVRFDDPQAYFQIIEAAALIDPKLKSGRFGTQDTAAAAVQGQQVFDVFKGVPVVNQIATQVMGGLSNFQAAAGSLGGSLNNQTTNSSIFDPSSAPFTKTIAEKALSAATKDRPQITVKVPLQSGITVTVGNQANYQLLPVTSNVTIPSVNPLSGNWLVAHLTHNLVTTANKVSGTTTMQSIKVN